MAQLGWVAWPSCAIADSGEGRWSRVLCFEWVVALLPRV